MNPSFLNLFMKKFARGRVAPIISASVLLRDPRQHAMCLVWFTLTRQQQRPGEPLFGGVEELIDEVRFDTHVPSQHVRDEPVREGVLIVEPANRLLFRDDQHGR